MKEEDEEEREAEKFDNLMIWAVRGTGKKYDPESKKWKTAVAKSKKRGGKKTRKHHRKHNRK